MSRWKSGKPQKKTYLDCYAILGKMKNTKSTLIIHPEDMTVPRTVHMRMDQEMAARELKETGAITSMQSFYRECIDIGIAKYRTFLTNQDK